MFLKRLSHFLVMPGANCSIYGCSSNRIHSAEISIFSPPNADDELSIKTRKEWVNKITRNRHVDKDLQRQIDKGTLHVCEKHFEDNCIEKRKCLSFFLNIYHIPRLINTSICNISVARRI